MAIDLNEIISVKEITDFEVVNKFLESGWVLITCLSSEYSGIVYSLGWLKSNGEIKEPVIKKEPTFSFE